MKAYMSPFGFTKIYYNSLTPKPSQLPDPLSPEVILSFPSSPQVSPPSYIPSALTITPVSTPDA